MSEEIKPVEQTEPVQQEVQASGEPARPEAVEEQTESPGKPVGPATIVEDEPMIEQFPTHDESSSSQ